MNQAVLADFEDFVPILFNSKIYLRSVEIPDLAELLPISYYDGVLATTMQDAEKMHQKINEDIINRNSIHWAIVQKSSNKVVGTCGFYRGFSDCLGELGCVLLPDYQGKGIMASALSLAIDFGFDELKFKQICAVTSSENLKAIKLLEKLNFTKAKEEGGSARFELEL